MTATVPASGRVLVLLSANLFVGQESGAIMSFASTGGAGDVTPDVTSPFARAIFAFLHVDDPRTRMQVSASAAIPVTGLSPGNHTFTAKYQSLTSTFVTFSVRRITVLPLP